VDIHEYQAKEILQKAGVGLPRGAVAFSAEQAVYAATELGGWRWVVKAQVHAGARGKAGGIKLCQTYHEVREAAEGMLGRTLVTHQTGPQGKPVQRVYVEGSDEGKMIPTDGVPALMKHARPVHEFVEVDMYVPGCPPPAKAILGVVTDLLEGRKPEVKPKVKFG